MKMNAKEHLQTTCSQLEQLQCGLNEAMNTVEKPNNKKEVQKALDAVKNACSIANTACQNYRD